LFKLGKFALEMIWKEVANGIGCGVDFKAIGRNGAEA
jgi:hypothetical protein